MYDGWELLESGSSSGPTTILLLAGAMCSADFFAEVVADPRLGSFRMIAATLPGFAGTPRPDDLSMEANAGSCADLATKVGADVVVGHSLGANYAIEMAAAGRFSGPTVLLSPSFCSKDEMQPLPFMAKVGKVPGLGPAVWSLLLKIMPKAMGKELPEARRDALVADMKKNDPVFSREIVGHYFRYLDRHGSVAPRLCESGVRSWVVYGDHKDVSLTDDERRTLDACHSVRLLPPIEHATHMTLLDQPARVVDVILEAVAAA